MADETKTCDRCGDEASEWEEIGGCSHCRLVYCLPCMESLTDDERNDLWLGRC
jgi:hypothetical protein